MVRSIDWRVIRDGARDGATQMALEEAAAETARTESLGTVRVYGWEPSAVTLGYNQPPETIDWAYCDDTGIDVTRRQTGGGGIYHDAHGDVAYTIVAPLDVVPGDLMACYELFCTPILEALGAVGVEAAFADTKRAALFEPSCYMRDVHPAHDVVVDGAKVSGNAQYRQRDVVIQHGSITFERDPDRLLAVFSDHGLTRSDVENRVTSVTAHADVSRDTLREQLASSLATWCDGEAGDWRPAERERAAELVTTKYGHEDWIRHRTAPASG